MHCIVVDLSIMLILLLTYNIVFLLIFFKIYSRSAAQQALAPRTWAVVESCLIHLLLMLLWNFYPFSGCLHFFFLNHFTLLDLWKYFNFVGTKELFHFVRIRKLFHQGTTQFFIFFWNQGTTPFCQNHGWNQGTAQLL